MTQEINHKGWLFSPARNQANLNQCIPLLTVGWMANTDIQPPTSLHAVLSYIGKYVSKPEKSSLSYTELQSQVLPYINDRAPLLSFVSKMLNKLIGERDWSAQEVSHLLLQIPVQESPLADFEPFVRRRPGVDFTARGDLLDNLGSREVDLSFNWSAHIGQYNEIHPEVWEQMKAENPIELRVDYLAVS